MNLEINTLSSSKIPSFRIDRVSAIIVRQNNCKILLGRHGGYQWRTFGGKVQGSETLQQTLTREIKEEFSEGNYLDMLLDQPSKYIGRIIECVWQEYLDPSLEILEEVQIFHHHFFLLKDFSSKTTQPQICDIEKTKIQKLGYFHQNNLPNNLFPISLRDVIKLHHNSWTPNSCEEPQVFLRTQQQRFPYKQKYLHRRTI